MTRPVDLVNAAAVAGAVAPVGMQRETSSLAAVNKVPTKGHFNFTLTSKKANAGAANVILRGTNNPDPADANGEALITNAHAGSDQKDGSAANKGYKYVFVDVSAGTFNAGDIRLHGTGEGTVG